MYINFFPITEPVIMGTATRVMSLRDGNKKMSTREIKKIGNSIDTIITYDVNTFEEVVQVVVNNLKGEDVNKLRLMQDWVWDEKTKELNIRFVGFKPIIDRFDDKGKFLNSGPIFTRRPDWDKK